MPSGVSTPIPPINTHVLDEVIDLGMTELTSMVENLGHITINFSALSMYEAYDIENVTVAEMKVREGVLVN